MGAPPAQSQEQESSGLLVAGTSRVPSAGPGSPCGVSRVPTFPSELGTLYCTYVSAQGSEGAAGTHLRPHSRGGSSGDWDQLAWLWVALSKHAGVEDPGTHSCSGAAQLRAFLRPPELRAETSSLVGSLGALALPPGWGLPTQGNLGGGDGGGWLRAHLGWGRGLPAE